MEADREVEEASEQTIYFYSHHPISAELILRKVGAEAGRAVRPEELWAHDQDHFGGTAATDELARQAVITDGVRVVDFCSGLGGTLRYLAHRYGATSTGVELTPCRVRGGCDLNTLVGLADRVRIIHGDVCDVPLENESADVVISQEAFCHVPNLPKALSEAFRILRKGGHLAFTDWVANHALLPRDVELMWEGMAIQPLQTLESYSKLVLDAGFRVRSLQNLTQEWGPILRERLLMYQKLSIEAHEQGTAAGHDAFHRSYVRFVELVGKEVLGGIRLVAVK